MSTAVRQQWFLKEARAVGFLRDALVCSPDGRVLAILHGESVVNDEGRPLARLVGGCLLDGEGRTVAVLEGHLGAVDSELTWDDLFE